MEKSQTISTFLSHSVVATFHMCDGSLVMGVVKVMRPEVF